MPDLQRNSDSWKCCCLGIFRTAPTLLSKWNRGDLGTRVLQKSVDQVPTALLGSRTRFRNIDPASAGAASGEMLRGPGWVCAQFWRRYGSLANQRLVRGSFPAAGPLGLRTPILFAPAWDAWATLATRSGWRRSCLPPAFPPGSGLPPIAEGWPGAVPSGEPLLCFYLPFLGRKLPLAPGHGPLALPSAQLACSASASISSSSWPYFSSTAGCCPLLW